MTSWSQVQSSVFFVLFANNRNKHLPKTLYQGNLSSILPSWDTFHGFNVRV